VRNGQAFFGFFFKEVIHSNSSFSIVLNFPGGQARPAAEPVWLDPDLKPAGAANPHYTREKRQNAAGKRGRQIAMKRWLSKGATQGKPCGE
jgi:hypothetical protein